MNLNKNADISIFVKKIRKGYFFTCRKAKTFIKLLRLHGKWYHENHFRYVSNNKIVAKALLAPLTVFL